ncbi:MAG TPA: hypothetical protein VFY54_17570 [Rubrobacter sp.]|nr:hypothetical protein [Rubrobacter sp.]
MGDDRILVIPPLWAPDWRTSRPGGAVATLLSELEAFLPLDIFEQPTLKGARHKAHDVAGLIEAMKSDIRPMHHVVEVGGGPGEPVLVAVAESEARSVVICGFYPSPRTLARRGDQELAQAVHAMYLTLVNNPGQALSIVMQDADDSIREAALQRIEETVDRQALRRLGEDLANAQFSAEGQVTVPALYLGLSHFIPANSGQIDLFREYAPGARYDELGKWGPFGHLEAAGYEFAGKVIPFIKEVIAEREATRQT